MTIVIEARLQVILLRPSIEDKRKTIKLLETNKFHYYLEELILSNPFTLQI